MYIRYSVANPFLQLYRVDKVQKVTEEILVRKETRETGDKGELSALPEMTVLR